MRKLINGARIDLGVCYYPEHWDRKLWAQDLDRMLAAGLKTVRVAEFAWSLIEPREGEYTYTELRGCVVRKQRLPKLRGCVVRKRHLPGLRWCVVRKQRLPKLRERLVAEAERVSGLTPRGHR